MVDVYSGEPERKAALAEVTALRRQFDTTTAKGAAAFAKDPAAQAALARLDAAKSAVGMRTAAEDLAALNKFATSDVATANQTPAQRQAERQGLNQPSRAYFNQVKEAYKNPEIVPTWKAPKQITPDLIKQYAEYGTDASRARFDWIWTEDPESGKGRWGMGLVGLLKEKPLDLNTADQLDVFYSDAAPLAQAKKGPSWNAAFNGISLDELEEALPNISFSQLQEIYYQLTLARDTDITIEDILDKYDDMFGEG